METDDTKLLVELQDLLAGGKKIEAIKRCREATGLGLAEAKEMVERLERGSRLSQITIDAASESEIVSLLEGGKKIPAIKLYRERTGAGLKEAKEAVEAIAAERRIALPRSGCLGAALAVFILLALLLTAGVTAEPDNKKGDVGRAVTGTFSIVAVDPETGVCGAAVASKYPSVGTVVPYCRAGVGAFCTQHWHEPKWGERALDLLAQGKLPEEVLGELLRDDKQRDKRQLAIIDIQGRAANRNPANADPSGIYWGAMSGRYYACQGNTLAGREVITSMAKAYEQTHGTVADRLIAALTAADRAGGDHRGRLAAGIRVVKKGVPGYWLELQVDGSDDAVSELAKKYAELKHDAKGR